MLQPGLATRYLLRFLTLALALAICLLVPRAGYAFDTGYHFDLTRDAFLELGVPGNADSLTICQVANYYCDGFESAKAVLSRDDTAIIHGLWDMIYGPAEIRDLSDTYMHFDALNGDADVARAWNRLLVNTYQAAQKARRDNDIRGFLMLTGMTSHMVQDFYAHANWAEQRDWGGDATWFDVAPAARAHAGIYTRNHEHLNRDYAGRPFFEKSYRLAYYATVQWLSALRDAVGADFWNRAMADRDSGLNGERNFVKYLSWYTGHWKGPSSASSDDLLVVAAAYVNPALEGLRRPYTDKWREYCRLIAREPDPRATAPLRFPYVERRKWVKVEITDVRQTDDDPVIDIDPGGQADFYAKVKVNGLEYLEAMHEDQDHIQPTNWITLAPIRPDERNLRVELHIIDEDTTAGQAMGRGQDDPCDISPAAGRKYWFMDGAVSNFPAHQAFHSDGGPNGDGDEAAVDFTVDLGEPPRGGQPPTVATVSPGRLARFSTGASTDVTIRGTHFYHPVTVSFGPGIVMRGAEVTSPTEIRAVIHLEPGAAPGPRDVSVSTYCGEGLRHNGFMVLETAAPTITGVYPAGAQAGSSLEVLISGDNLFGATGVDFGDGIRVDSFEVISPRSGVYAIKAEITVAATAVRGRRQVTVTRDRTVTGRGGSFMVLAASTATAPVINSVSPSSEKQSKTVAVVIRGANLSGATTVSFGAGITVTEFRVVSGNEIRATLRIDPYATTGARDVAVTTPAGRTVRPGIFRVDVLLD